MTEQPCTCAFHTVHDPNSRAITAPDLSVTVTDDEAMRALNLFDLTDWDKLEATLPDGNDRAGVPFDRRNRNIRIALLAESLQFVRSAEEGKGIEMLSNPYYEQYVGLLLDGYDQARSEGAS